MCSQGRATWIWVSVRTSAVRRLCSCWALSSTGARAQPTSHTPFALPPCTSNKSCRAALAAGTSTYCQHITPTVAVSGMHDIPENYILHKGKAKDKLELNLNHLRCFGGLTTSTFSKQGAYCKTSTMLQNKQNQHSLVL